MESRTLDTRRIGLYLVFAFGISWATGGIIWLTGGLQNSPILVPGTTLTVALVLLATFYMWGPALAHILTRLVTREGWQNAQLRGGLRRGWIYWVLAWVLPAVLTILGAALYFYLYPAYYDAGGSLLRQQILAVTGNDLQIPLMAFAVSQTIQAVLLAPILNAIPTFGEEFGWRGYLQPKLMPLGGRKAVLLVGVIWGVWHWPVIAMGYNYGFDYAGFPWLGLLGMVWFCIVLGVIIGWLALRGGSVWPAVIAHGAVNGIAGIGGLFIAGTPNLLLGPTPVGVIALIPFTILALVILLVPGALKPAQEPEPGPLVDGAVSVPKPLSGSGTP